MHEHDDDIYVLTILNLNTSEYYPGKVEVKAFKDFETLEAYAAALYEQKLAEGYTHDWIRTEGTSATWKTFKPIEDPDQRYGLIHLMVASRQTIT